MKNIFKEYKNLIIENNLLKTEIERLKKENNEEYFKIKEMYEKTYQKRLEYETAKYNTKIKRKNEVLQLCKSLEYKINKLCSLIDTDVSTDVECLIKLLNYLKED